METQEPNTPRDDAPADTGAPKEKRRRRRFGRGVLLALFAFGVLAGALAAVLVRSQRGQRAVLDAVLSRVRDGLAGTLVVDSIRSPSLLGGAMLVGVHLQAEGDRPFLDADSVRLRYSLLRVVGSQPRIGSVTLYSPRVVISRYAGEDAPNVTRLLAPTPEGGDATAAPGTPSSRVIVLDQLRVEGGTLDVLSPLDGAAPARVPTIAAPEGGGRLRRLSLGNLDLSLGDVRVRPGADSLFAADLAGLATEVSVLDRPIRITDAQGRVSFGAAGLRIDSVAVDFPGSALTGSMALGPRDGLDGWGFSLDLRTRRPAALADLTWLDDRIPAGTWRGEVGVDVSDGLRVDLGDVNVGLEASSLSANGTVTMGDQVTFRRMELRANPVAVTRLEPWLGRSLPVDGWVSGRMSLSGPLSALASEGRLTLVSTGHPGGPTTADFRGTLHVGRDPGVTDLHVVADPVNYATVGSLLPSAPFTGTGRVVLDAAGRVDDGIRFVADVGHRTDSATVSRVLARGSLRRAAAGRWVTDTQGDLSPLSLGLLAGVAPSLGLRGDVMGSVRVVGALDSLRVTGELQGGSGKATVDGRLNALNLADGYRLDTEADGVTVSDFVGALPAPTEWSGRLRLDGRGTAVDSVNARVSMTARSSRVGGLHVDSARAELVAARGLLTVDTLEADLGGVAVSGGGDVGMTRPATGEAHLVFHTADLGGLRSIFLGDMVTVQDSLTALDRERLRLEGVNADTLPTRAEVDMSGSLDGDVTLRGSLDALDVKGSATVSDGMYGRDRVGNGELTFDVRRLLSDTREGRVEAQVGDVRYKGRSFSLVTADLDVLGRGGDGTLSVTRSGSERYDLRGSFALDTLGGGRADLAEATFALDSMAWRLTRPTTVAWDTASVTLDDVSVTRDGADPMSLKASGTLAWLGSSDLTVEARGLHMDRLSHIAQLDDLGLGGHLDLDLTVTGPAGSPRIDGSFGVVKPRYGDLSVDSLGGTLAYEDQVARVQLDATDNRKRVFRAQGSIPVNLALDAEGRRTVNRPMDVRVTADSLDAAVALSYLDVLEDVHGMVSGDFRIGGTLDSPEPQGVLHLQDAGWSIEALGVRHVGVEGSLTLNADRTVDAQLSTGTGTGTGTSTVQGRVTLDPVRNPRLDLTMKFQNFLAVSRRDVVGRISGETHLTGTYQKPLLEGDLTVDQGTLFLDEFARSAEVVDLTDPRWGLVVDTAAFSGRPLLAEINNPFLENLRADVRLSVPRDTWLRSEDMNVEMGGNLIVSYDRSERDVVMVGELQALRGSYTVLGRRFDVQSGTVGFPGTPGINPTLDIQALTRVRRAETNPMEVTATVSGTLTQPRVSLSTNEQGVAQSDLVSYLIFGRPSYQITTGDSNVGSGAGASVTDAAAGATVGYLSGQLATRLGTALSQQISFLDYLSISQQGRYGVAQGVLNGTQVELGQYIGDNVFVVLVFRAPSEQAGTQNGVFGGARVEVEMTDDYNVQGFWEDRFLRSGTGGFGDLAEDAKVIGVFIFREWGY